MKLLLTALIFISLSAMGQTGKPVDTFRCQFDYIRLKVKDKSGNIISNDTSMHYVVGWMVVYKDTTLFFSPGFKKLSNARVKNYRKSFSIKLFRD